MGLASAPVLTSMRAAVYHGVGDIRIEDVDVPAPAAGEVLLQVAAVGVCGTDAHEYAHGPRSFPVRERHPVSGHVGPMIPGHEMVGYVAALGHDVSGLAIGDLVASGAGISCGHCRLCRAGRTSLCETYVTVGLQRHGALAQYVAVPASTCVDVSPYELDPVTAALGQPMAIAVHSLRRGRAQAPDVAAVVGVGGIGAFLVFALARSGVQVVAADLATERRELAVRLGAVAGLDPRAAAVVDGGTGALPQVDVVFEVTGTPSGLETALAWATPGTRVVLVGLQKDPISVDARRVSLTELELIGTNAHAVREDLPEALRLLGLRAEGWRDVAPDLLSLDDLVAQGLEPMARGESSRIKTLVDPWADESGPVP